MGRNHLMNFLTFPLNFKQTIILTFLKYFILFWRVFIGGALSLKDRNVDTIEDFFTICLHAENVLVFTAHNIFT